MLMENKKSSLSRAAVIFV